MKGRLTLPRVSIKYEATTSEDPVSEVLRLEAASLALSKETTPCCTTI